MTEVKRSKEWWLTKARAEGDATIGAGGISRLDDATEKGIREACGAISTQQPFTTWHPQEVYEKFGQFIRGAIIADREARQKQERDLADGLAKALKAARSYYVYDHRLGGRESENAELRLWDELLRAYEEARRG